MTDPTDKMSFRLNSDVHAALAKCAKSKGYETTAYVQKVLTEHAIASGHMSPDAASKAKAYEELFALAISKARSLYDQGKFNEDWNLIVFQHLMDPDEEFRSKYEKAIGGNAYTIGLPGKTPLNMYLGWYIKNAVGAVPKTTPDGKPVRVMVKNEPIQTYTRLLRGPAVAAPHPV